MPSFDFNNLGHSLVNVVASEAAPFVFKGYIIEFFKSKKLDVKTVCQLVENNTSLWALMDNRGQEKVRNLVRRLGNIDWLTSEYLINAVKGEFPRIASLFLGWRKAHNWLERQMEEIKKQVQ